MSFRNPSYHPNKATNRYEFDIENMDLAIVNGIRRTILADIPNLGLLGEGDVTVEIQRNTGPLHNELMAHRISMIPIHFTEEEVESFTEGDYEFSCSIKNHEQTIMNVTTKHLQGTRQAVPLSDKELARLFPHNSITNQHVLITRLRPGEELAFTAKVIKSTAKEHSSFSPVSLCAFFYHQDPAKAEDAKGVLDKERAYLKNKLGDPTSIHFMIEPEEGLSAKYLVAKALEILLEKIERVHREIDVLDSTYVRIVASPQMEKSYDLHILQEDDTLGNIFQSILYSHFIREKNKVLENRFTVSYVGYYTPHPLDPRVVVRMSLQNDSIVPDEKDFAMVMKECCRHVEREVRKVYDEWTRFDV